MSTVIFQIYLKVSCLSVFLSVFLFVYKLFFYSLSVFTFLYLFIPLLLWTCCSCLGLILTKNDLPCVHLMWRSNKVLGREFHWTICWPAGNKVQASIGRKIPGNIYVITLCHVYLNTLEVTKMLYIATGLCFMLLVWSSNP